MVSTPLLIGGEERQGAATFPVYDPAHTGAIVGHAAAASADDALDAVAAAHAAWPAWAALSATERTAIVLKALDGLEADADERAETLSKIDAILCAGETPAELPIHVVIGLTSLAG